MEAQEGPWGGTWPSLQVRDSFLKKAHTGWNRKDNVPAKGGKGSSRQRGERMARAGYKRWRAWPPRERKEI